LDPTTQTAVADAAGNVGNLAARYSSTSRATIDAVRLPAGQDLVDYVSATAGKDGSIPFNSPLAPSIAEVVAGAASSCQ
jgi:hypothetical protein